VIYSLPKKGKIEYLLPQYFGRKRYSDLAEPKKLQVKTVFTNLSVEAKTGLLKECVVLANRAVRTNQPSITKDEKARLFHIMFDPLLAEVLDRTQRPLPRQELDDKSQRGSAYEALATAFNDYQTYSYMNCIFDPRETVEVSST
jgi:hypothetical protein